MNDSMDARELAVVETPRPKASLMRRRIVWIAGLSVVGGLSFSLLTAVERARESAARMR